MNDDIISRQAAIDAVKKNTFRLTFAEEQNCEGHVAWSAEAVYSDVMEGALLELPSAQPEQIARDIATIIENEKDMRVILKNAEHTETHECVYRHTVTHDWIPVTEALPRDDEEVIGMRGAMTMNKRMIYAEDAIDAVANGLKGVFVEYQDVAEKLLNNVPSAKPEQQWIPVSEALPKDGVTVWVTIRWHDVIWVWQGFYCETNKSWCSVDGFPMMVQPVAWMPMEVPEPYKGGQE